MVVLHSSLDPKTLKNTEKVLQIAFGFFPQSLVWDTVDYFEKDSPMRALGLPDPL